VLDFAQNNGTLESLSQVYGPFLETLRAKHADSGDHADLCRS